uniref:Beta1 4 mannosyltransferase n=1 Tax=Rhizophora mucronata TaxID=61149 RepID=A0A2P2M0D5_RHIMU
MDGSLCRPCICCLRDDCNPIVELNRSSIPIHLKGEVKS